MSRYDSLCSLCDHALPDDADRCPEHPLGGTYMRQSEAQPPSPSEPTCQQREFTAEDQATLDRSGFGMATGPECGKPAKWIECGEQLKVCDDHRCRCKMPLHPPPEKGPAEVWVMLDSNGKPAAVLSSKAPDTIRYTRAR